MCGIAGVFSKQDPELVERMLDKLNHRGPDGRDIKNLSAGTLGHTRLAILDIEGGHQPMGIDSTWITFNGEIYNYRELAHTYLATDSLQTRCDTEVILHLYRKLGPRCVELLDGMFAFAILDGNDLFMARDPLGIKPIYCGRNNSSFYFASEVKALAEATDKIYEFPAGCWFHSRKGWHSYFDIDEVAKGVPGEVDILESIRAVLKEAVQKRLLGDVPVAVSLSGGLDSSIVAMLAKQQEDELYSFAVGMEDSEDLTAARKVAQILGTRHYERIYTAGEILNILPKAVYHLESFDPALVRSAIPNYFLADMASEHVKVILTGEGADEIYARYDYLRSIESPDELQGEMIDITAELHNTNLQRADRIPMAFGLEARVPFLDVKSVALGLGLPAAHKVHRDWPTKYLLRQAFRSDLPQETVNRPKQKFSKGAGSSDFIAEVAKREVSDAEFQSESNRLLKRWGYHLLSKEALYYYNMLRQYYEDRWVFPSMGHSRSL